ncbi:MAG: NYN domain-containing protein [Actinomycetota bacterium]
MDRKLALFIDFENIARGVRQHHLEERVDLRAILSELEEKGRILVKRAYADWGYFKDYRSDLLQQGVEPVQVFAASRDREGWKNGADLRIAIDAIETAFRSPDITDFVLVSGDSDFLSLVNRLRENGKMVWGMGLRSSSSQYLMKSCDHFILYEDIAEWLPEPQHDGSGHVRRDSRQLLLATLRRMSDRQGLPGMPPPGTPLKATAVKSAMRRIDPSWDENFEGYTSFREFVQAHDDVVVCGRPGDSPEHFVAERGTVAEANLQRMLDFTQRSPAASLEESVSVAPAPEPQPQAAPAVEASVNEPLPRAEVIAALRDALRAMGSAEGDDLVQRYPVRGAHLKARLQRVIPGFDESAYGFSSFLDFLLSMRDQFRVVRAEVRGDVLVAERESPADVSLNGQPEATPGGVSAAWSQSPEQRYLGALRIRRIRHVPMEERYEIIRALCNMFEEARSRQENLSLKEAKDRLHERFEQTEPSVAWDSVNNAVYHLFWTYCFEFGEAEDEVPLWDRPTQWNGGLQCAEEVTRRCDIGLVRMISEVVGVVDPRVVLDVLGDGDLDRLPYFEEICSQVNQRFAVPGR